MWSDSGAGGCRPELDWFRFGKELISLVGGAARLWGSVVLLHGLSAWQPFPQYPLNMPVNPGIAVELSE